MYVKFDNCYIPVPVSHKRGIRPIAFDTAPTGVELDPSNILISLQRETHPPGFVAQAVHTERYTSIVDLKAIPWEW